MKKAILISISIIILVMLNKLMITTKTQLKTNKLKNYNLEETFDISDYFDFSVISEEQKNEIIENISEIENGTYDITYELFGAIGDGVADDTHAIKAAHDFANAEYVYNSKLLTVKGTSGKTYYIGSDANKIIIGTNVDWQNAHFIVDDGKEGVNLSAPIFKVLTKMGIKANQTYLQLDKEIIASLNINVTKETQNLSQLATYIKEMEENEFDISEFEEIKLELNSCDQYMIAVYNSNVKHHIRNGANASTGNDQQDRFIMDKEGNILNEIVWDFEEITYLRIYPIYQQRIQILNGNFTTRTNNEVYTSSGTKNNYVQRNIYIEASNVDLKNINHYIDEEYYLYTGCEYQDIENANLYEGFIKTFNCANINFENIKLSSHTYSHMVSNGVINTTSANGTYDMNIQRTVNINLKGISYNVKEEQDEKTAYYENMLNTASRWSTIGMSFNKDMQITDSKVNVVSSHQGTYNITIKDSTIGKRGIVLLGGGKLEVDNVKIDQASSLIKFHDDYGSTWNGDVIINEVEYVVQQTAYSIYLINSNRSESWDFGYQCYFPNIKIKNLTIDDSLMTNDIKKIHLIGMRESASTTLPDTESETFYPYYMLNKIILRNINTISGRKIYISSNHFKNSQYLKQIRYANKGENEKTNIIVFDDIELNSDEMISDYNIESGQFNVNMNKVGDINSDNSIDAFDAYKTLEESISDGLEDDMIYYADVDNDYEVTAFDAYSILKQSVGIN